MVPKCLIVTLSAIVKGIWHTLGALAVRAVAQLLEDKVAAEENPVTSARR